jgi:hypothetical protein
MVLCLSASATPSQLDDQLRYVYALCPRGLDVMLVIEATSSMEPVIDDVRGRMAQLAGAIFRLVPSAQMGIIVFRGKGAPMQVQPLTSRVDELREFLSNVVAADDGEPAVDALGAVAAGINAMLWHQVKKVVVLVGASPPGPEDMASMIALLRQFREEGGTFNSVEVVTDERLRSECESRLVSPQEQPPSIAPPPATEEPTIKAFKTLAEAGGGSLRSLLLRDGEIRARLGLPPTDHPVDPCEQFRSP